MIGMQYKFEVEGSLEAKWKREGKNEPISVLDKRSPSPSTSTSTLSSSFGASGGGGSGSGSTDNMASVAAVSDSNTQQKWQVSALQGPGFSAVMESSAADGGGGGGGRKEEWGAELQEISDGLGVVVAGGERFGVGIEDWESLLSESAQDQSLLRWISGDVEETQFTIKKLLQSTNPSEIAENDFKPISNLSSIDDSMVNLTPNFSSDGGSGFSSDENDNGKVGSISPNSSSLTLNCKVPNFGSNTTTIFTNSQNPIFTTSLNNSPLGLNYQHQQFESPNLNTQIFNPQQVFMNQQIPHNQNLFDQPQPKRQHLGISETNPQSQIPKAPFFDLQKPLMVPKQEVVTGEKTATTNQHYQQQKQVTYDQLYKAAELIIAGNFSHAQAILARLNHQLSPLGKPFQRAAFYFKEALQLALLMPNSTTPINQPTAFDAIFKMGAYKAFSEVSPLVQFANFTSNQAILEVLDEATRIHIMDFDIGFGAQWASFMQELPRRNRGGNGFINPSLKITAFASPSTHHPFELGLMHENLTQFANEIGVHFELEVVNFDSFDPSSYTMPGPLSSENEAVAVNLPIWACLSRLFTMPSLLRFIKQLSPKIVVSLDSGFERTDLPFPHHLLHSLQYYEVLFDSIDASNVNSDISNKIEKFLFQPKIEKIMLGRLGLGLTSPEKMPHWKSLFGSAGFSPMPFSNFSETQGEYVAKRSPGGQGFRVEKRQSSLVLSWQRRELVSASAWRC